MSRIKGNYPSKFATQLYIRWLDTSTGECFDNEVGGTAFTRGFKLTSDGTWVSEYAGYRFTPDAQPAADWYVIRLVPDEFHGRPERVGGYPPIFTSFGPYTEAEARANAELRSEKSTGSRGITPPKPYGVVQLLAGNTVLVQPPAPPKPIANWS